MQDSRFTASRPASSTASVLYAQPLRASIIVARWVDVPFLLWSQGSRLTPLQALHFYLWAEFPQASHIRGSKATRQLTSPDNTAIVSAIRITHRLEVVNIPALNKGGGRPREHVSTPPLRSLKDPSAHTRSQRNEPETQGDKNDRNAQTHPQTHDPERL